MSVLAIGILGGLVVGFVFVVFGRPLDLVSNAVIMVVSVSAGAIVGYLAREENDDGSGT
jgi:hypothetical protein